MCELFENRKEKRHVTETVSAILLGLIEHLKEDDADCVRRALYLLNQLGIEGEQKNDG